LARRLGADESVVAGVRPETPEEHAVAHGDVSGLEPSWGAALTYAEALARSGHSVDDAIYGELERYWNEGEIVEISLVAGVFSYFNRFNDALRVEVTR
jgi:alkylhydroperoxidase family enzyme